MKLRERAFDGENGIFDALVLYTSYSEGNQVVCRSPVGTPTPLPWKMHERSSEAYVVGLQH